ncbi:N-acetylmuramoyl-L-alanine amidase [Nonomuraea maritima]|uniref:N-acetylmuramoyl-L-alanine amidase n=1 Tax=Nonomuraea maritima TaxID=683260 RepID=A0A1G9KFJ8_9ACTN|nr:N-acetylmuramoyl-L-alanine amidase [Nonomuraea maritima]SDL48409.1 N-acetylmuramoyl-L-alanine amidase [Nonomuraea maritima]
MRALPALILALCGLTASACGAGSDGATAGQATLTPVPTVTATVTVTATDEPPAIDTAAPEQPEVKPLDGKVIVIDPGHNGGNYRDPQAVNRLVDVLTQRKACDTTGTATNDGYSEAAFTWDVSKRLRKLLRRRGATVEFTRSDNDSVGPCITERAAIGNEARADAAISVHADGSAAANHGFHVIMPKRIGGPVDRVVAASRRLGLAVRDAFHAGTGVPYSTYIGRKALDYRSDLGGLNLSTVPKVFVECGNMRNAAEAAQFRDPEFRQRIALALADGLQHYLHS